MVVHLEIKFEGQGYTSMLTVKGSCSAMDTVDN